MPVNLGGLQLRTQRLRCHLAEIDAAAVFAGKLLAENNIKRCYDSLTKVC